MMDLEELLLDTLDAVSGFRVGQREAVACALRAGGLLAQAKSQLPHGGWGDWLRRCGLKPRTATQWMRLAESGLDVEEVIDRGGIAAALAGAKPKSASDADLEEFREPPEQRELEGVEAELARAKRAYYDALSHRQRLLRRMAKGS